MAFSPIHSSSDYVTLVSNRDNSSATVIYRPEPFRPRGVLSKNENGISRYEIENTRSILAPQVNKTSNLYTSVVRNVSLNKDEIAALEVLRAFEQIVRKHDRVTTLVTSIKNYSSQSNEEISEEVLKELEIAAVEAMHSSEQPYEPNDTISNAFHIVAKGYMQQLIKASDVEKSLLKQRITIYLEFALKFASTGEIKAGIYSSFALYYQSQENYPQELIMWSACLKQPSGKTAYNQIGEMYRDGRGVVQNEERAIQYFLKGEESNDQDAQFNVAKHYDIMRVSSTDLREKNEYRRLAINAYLKISVLTQKTNKHADESSFRASFLTDLNENGEFDPKQVNKSLLVYRQAWKADPTNYVIINTIAMATFFKNNTMKSATTLFKKAAKLGSALANSFSKLKTEEEKKVKLAEFCKTPDQIYTEKT